MGMTISESKYLILPKLDKENQTWRPQIPKYFSTKNSSPVENYTHFFIDLKQVIAKKKANPGDHKFS